MTTPFAWGAAPDAPTNLRVNDVANPVGTGTAPYFGWYANDPDTNEIQTSYQIMVASTEANIDADNGDMWDSGSVTNRMQNHVTYAGSALASDRKYFWKVRTWDKDGNAGVWSDTASFTVGLTSSSDWSGASWIKRDTTDTDDYTYFRKQATLDNKTIEQATVYISSVHKYALYINDTLVGKGPAYHHPQYQYYNAYDITELVETNTTNQFAIFNHWFGGGQGRPESARGVIMKAVVHYTDGTTTTVGTDGTWKQSQAAAWSLAGLTPHNKWEGVGYIEKINAGNLITNWTALGFDDSSWTSATVIGSAGTSPWTKALAPDFTRIQEAVISPASITNLSPGKYVVDLGKIYAGMPRIQFSGGTSNTSVNMRGGYVLTAGGEVDSDTARNQQTDMSYYAILDGGTFTYEPVEYLGMRYFQIDNAPMPVTMNNFEFVVRHSRMDTSASSFESPNSTLNAVWDLMKHSILTCAQESFVDTPTREKGGFVADTVYQSSVAMPVMNERALTRRTLGEFPQSMDQYWTTNGVLTGQMSKTYPSFDGDRDIPDWTQSYLVGVWNYYMETGDLEFLVSYYDYFKAIADYVHAAEDGGTGLVSNLPGGSGSYRYGIVDWPSAMRFGYDMTYARTVINGWAYADFDIMAKIAGEVGNTTDQAVYQGYADALKMAMKSQLINESGVYVDGLSSDGSQSSHVSQQANAMPLALGIVPTAQQSSVVAKVKELEMKSGMAIVPWLIRGIGEADEGEHLIELFTNEDWLGWAQCLSNGATATWESWYSDTTANESMSHAWGASGLEGYVRYILGIKPTKPQYQEVRIKPLNFGSALGDASGAISTDRGAISVSWLSGADSFYRADVELPVNTTAEVLLPKGGAASTNVYVDSVLTTASEAGDFVVVTNVGSGTHTFIRTTGALPGSPPATPTGLSASTGEAAGQIDLSWTAADGAALYKVKRSSISGGPYTTISWNVIGTNYTDSGLSADTTYYYVVSAVNAVGEGGESAEDSAR